MRGCRNPGVVAALGLIRMYQAIPKGSAPRCRFLPSCSAYAADAIALHGVGRGVWLAGRRVTRCHPWNPGGVDPVPPAGDAEREGAQ